MAGADCGAAGPVRLTAEQAHEIVESAIACARMAQRRGSGIILRSDGIAVAYGLPREEAARVVECVGAMLIAREQAERDCLAALTDAGRAALEGGAGEGGGDAG